MKRITIIISTIALVMAFGIRVYVVNDRANEVSADIRVFRLREPVHFGNDFFFNSSESIPDYYITVISSELLKGREFAELHGVSGDEWESLEPHHDYVYLVRTIIRNDYDDQVDEYGNALKGLNMLDIQLANTNWMNMVSEIGCKIANDFFEQPSFAIRHGTELEVVFVYGVSSGMVDVESLRKDPPRLVISLYPTKKMLDTVPMP